MPLDQDQALMEFLKASRQIVDDFIENYGSDASLSRLISTSKDIAKYLNALLAFLAPCFFQESDTSIKKYEDCVYINRSIENENDIALILQQIQNESADLLSFLESLQIVLNSIHLVDQKYSQKSPTNKNIKHTNMFNNSRYPSKSHILAIHKENAVLSNELNILKSQIVSNEEKLTDLHKLKAKCSGELDRCVEVLSSYSQLEVDESHLTNRLTAYNYLKEYNTLIFSNT